VRDGSELRDRIKVKVINSYKINTYPYVTLKNSLLSEMPTDNFCWQTSILSRVLSFC
jgi:hypothetical protein